MTKFKDLKVGEKLSETQYYSVVKIGEGKVQLLNDHGENIVVDKCYVESCLTSSVQFEKEEKLNRTEIINIFINSPGTVMAVNYNKQVKEKDALEAMKSIYPNKGGKMLSEIEYSKKAKAILSSVVVGEERTMIGRHYGSINEFGRMTFTDMEKTKDPTKPDYDSRISQVDPRTINWLIVKGVKYIVK